MKKLMFAAAAIAAGVAVADVTSANIVGYQNVGLADGNKMVGAPFTTISQEGLLLEEFVPTGYEENEDLIAEIVENNDGYMYGDEFSFYTANPNGSIASEYGWVRSYDSGSSKWNDDGEWVKIGGADLARLANGEGVYANCNWFQEGCGFMTSGEAIVDPRNIPFKDGNFIMSNPLSSEVALNKIWPVGYEENEDLISEIVDNNDNYLYGDEFSFYTANPNGSIASEYGWVRSYDPDGSKWNDDGEWVKIGGADLETIASGEALYTNCNWFDEGCAMSFPGIDDKHLED